MLEGGGVGSRDSPGTLSYALSKETILLSRLRAVAAQCASKSRGAFTAGSFFIMASGPSLGTPFLASVTSAEATVRLNLAFESKAYSNRPLWAPGGWNISKLVNGDRQDVFHGDTDIPPGMAYQVDLGASVTLQEIVIYPRQDGCCPERLSNIRVSVHKDNTGQIGDPVWSADLFTDGSNAGSGPSST